MGKYRILAELGHGGMADVYLAVSEAPLGFKKLVVLKTLRPSLASDEEFLEMFVEEARLAARLNHPNVVQTYEVGFEHGRHVLVMEYLEGQSLSAVLDRARQTQTDLPLGLRLRVFADALCGLQYAHELCDFDGTPLRLVHRDFTPHNVFVVYEGHVKVLDFGIAKAANRAFETRGSVLKGKVRYMAPEQMLGEDVDSRSDIFSAGAILWELATLQHIWKGLDDVTVMNRVLEEKIPSPRSVNPDVPPQLDAIVMKALAHKRENRYQTTAELIRDVEDLLESSVPSTSRREIGAILQRMFEENRTRMRLLIEQQLASDDPHESGPLALLGAPLATQVSTLSGRSQASKNQQTEAAESSVIAVAANQHREHVKRRKLTLAGSAAIIALGVGGLVWQARRKPESPVATAPPVLPAPTIAPVIAPSPSASASTSAQAKWVDVKITASPTQAKLRLDGQPLGPNPFHKTLERDGKSHRIVAEAPGYAPEEIDVTFDRDVDVTLPLHRATPTNVGGGPKPSSLPSTAPSAAPAPPQPPPVAPVAPAASTTVGPQRPLDKGNPWNP